MILSNTPLKCQNQTSQYPKMTEWNKKDATEYVYVQTFWLFYFTKKKHLQKTFDLKIEKKTANFDVIL